MYECIEAITSDQFSFFCTVCKKKISCKHQGELDVKRHVASTSHDKFAKRLETQTQLKSLCHDAVATRLAINVIILQGVKLLSN